MRHPLTFTFLVLLALPACGEAPPTLDASGQANLDASIKRMNAGLDEGQKQQFAADCSTLTEPAARRSGPIAVLPDRLALFKPLDGLTVKQVHEKAELVRSDFANALEQEKARADATKDDRPAILAKAIDAVRKSTAEFYGSKGPVEVTAEDKWLAKQGDGSWFVRGLYVGPDRGGKKVKSEWTARVKSEPGGLQCEDVKLGTPGPVE